MRLLLENGHSNLTIRAVAQAAGVAETTVYRRWPSVGHLIAAALLRLTATDNPIPDTGSVEDDLATLLSQIVALLTRPDVMRVVRSAAAIDDGGAFAATRAAFFDARFTASAAIVERAVARGQLPAGTDSHRLIETLVAPAYMRALLGSRGFDDDFVDSSVAATLHGFDGRTGPPRP
ncbi:TetR family transcriptional regulator [Gordonia spumicola]|uniref:TetR family transcriptional regulator n=2 Tax=Gordonia spumicola TaxID=589161 RepID=A0A7I9VEP1_9ACTN|nr:TetR family transcriptional regulator [Gordonia spumicola]